MRSFGNVMAYASDFGSKWKAPGTIPDVPNAMFGNTIIFNPTGSMMYHDCSAWHAHDNTLYGPNISLPCSTKGMQKSYTLAEWQALDPKTHDVGSKAITTMPTGEQIVAMAKALLD